MRPVLEVENLSFSFEQGKPCLRDISFQVFEGECVGIVGPNGAGKSTLLWCLLGLLKSNGSIRLFGEKVSKRSLARVGVVFQNPEDQLFMPSLMEDLTLPLINRGLPREAARGRALETLRLMGLADLAERSATQLSLGERKRASIAAALAGSPELLLLDEPTAELDGRSERQLKGALWQLPVARVIATHHVEFLREITTRTLVLCDGRIVSEGPTRELLANESLLEEAGLI